MHFPEIFGQLLSLDAAILVMMHLIIGIIHLFFIVGLADVLRLALQPPAKVHSIQSMSGQVVFGEDLIDFGVDLWFGPLFIAFESA